MKNKRVKQMMVDVEKHCVGDIEPAWITWFDGVCVVAGANFLWPNKNHNASINSSGVRVNEKSN